MIRTCDPCVPNAVLYQAELHSECVGRKINDSARRQRLIIVAEHRDILKV